MLLGLFVSPLVPVALAETPGELELSELLPNPAPPLTDAHDEYIELHNPTTQPLALNTYSLRIGASTYPLPAQTVAPGAFAVVTSATATWTLTNTGGTATLLKGAQTVDAATWTTATSGAAWMKQTGQWQWTGLPTVGTANQLAPLTVTPTPAKTEPASDDSSGDSAIHITELMPDPVSPLTDAKDEYIELFNAGPNPVNLKGYSIKTGSTLSSKHTLASTTLAPGAHLALMSTSTKASLANAGSSVALYTPGGTQIGSTIIYSAAKPGLAWALVGDSWAWTTTPTPSATNVLTQPVSTVAAPGTAKAAATPKASKAKTTGTVKAAATKSTSPTKTPAPAVAGASASNGRWLLFALAGLTIAYIIYEFRYDIRNFYYRLRRHSSGGGTSGGPAEGRGSAGAI